MTLDEIKKQVALEAGYKSWENLRSLETKKGLNNYMDEVCIRYHKINSNKVCPAK